MTLGIILGFAAFFGIFKFLKLLRFNSKIAMLAKTLQMSVKELLPFGMFFVIVWGAFVQIIFVLLGDKSDAFSTIVKTFETTFSMILNKLPNGLANGKESIFGTLICITFYMSVVFTLLNILISIINDYFRMVRTDKNLFDEDARMFQYMIDKFKTTLSIDVVIKKLMPKKKNELNDNYSDNYAQHFDTLERKIERIIFLIEENNKKELY